MNPPSTVPPTNLSKRPFSIVEAFMDEYIRELARKKVNGNF
jgi:hypothetical protein